MFYVGSKLESDIEKLTNEVKKTDYQKAIEPYQARIYELEKKLYYQQKDMEALLKTAKQLIYSLEDKHFKVIVTKEPPTARFYPSNCNDALIERPKYHFINIPVKAALIDDFYRILNKNIKKYELEVADEERNELWN